MIRRLCAAAALVAGVGGGALLATPAHAHCGPGDLWSGNDFGDVVSGNRGAGASTNVNNVNGFTSTATHGGIAVTYIFD